MKRAGLFLCAMLLATFFAAGSLGQSVSFQQGMGGYTNSRCVAISQSDMCEPVGPSCNQSTWNYNGTTFADGDGDFLIAKDIPFYQNMSPLLRFENLSLPPGAKLVSASLTVVLNDQVGGTRAIARYLKRRWCADATTSGANLNCAGWRLSEAGVHWTVAGALGEDSDVRTNAPIYLPATGTLAGFVDTGVVVPLDVKIVQEWLDSPTNNHGIKLQGETSPSAISFVQPQRSGARPMTYRPKLTLNYVISPVLNIRANGNGQVRLSWSTNATGFVVRRAGAVNGTYTNANLTLSTEGNETVAYDVMQPSARYYRLAGQP